MKLVLTCDCGWRFTHANARVVAQIARVHVQRMFCGARGRTEVYCSCGWHHLLTTLKRAPLVMAAHAKASPKCAFRASCSHCGWTSPPFPTHARAIAAGKVHDVQETAKEAKREAARAARLADLKARLAALDHEIAAGNAQIDELQRLIPILRVKAAEQQAERARRQVAA